MSGSFLVSRCWVSISQSLNSEWWFRVFTMNRNEEIVDIENQMEFYFRNLDQDISFTSSQIADFHTNWQRLNELDPPRRSNRKGRLIYLPLCVLIVCLLCIIITIKFWSHNDFVSLSSAKWVYIRFEFGKNQNSPISEYNNFKLKVTKAIALFLLLSSV